MVLRISLPPMTACVLCGEISRALIGIPVRWVTVCGSPGLVMLEEGVSFGPDLELSTDLGEWARWVGGVQVEGRKVV
jgi:hypothetical protein